jgi:hypothetical protein
MCSCALPHTTECCRTSSSLNAERSGDTCSVLPSSRRVGGECEALLHRAVHFFLRSCSLYSAAFVYKWPPISAEPVLANYLSSARRGNMPPIVGWACDILRRPGYALCPYDKEAGKCSVKAANMQRLHGDMLHSASYRLVPSSHLDYKVEERRAALFAVARRIARLEGDFGRTLPALCSAAHLVGARHDAELKILCKSHKPPGAVSFRNLHCCPSPVGFGISS